MNPTRSPQSDISWDRFAALWMCSPDAGAAPRTAARWPLPLLRVRRYASEAPARAWRLFWKR
jgi:hypothetical protein